MHLISAGSSSSRDFLAIVLVEGFIQVVISLGSSPVVLDMSRGERLDDGEWHVVEVSRKVKVSRDYSGQFIQGRILGESLEVKME